NLTGAQLSGCEITGTIWYGAELSGMRSDFNAIVEQRQQMLSMQAVVENQKQQLLTLQDQMTDQKQQLRQWASQLQTSFEQMSQQA
ncbi:hypothetical protein ABTM48_20630, partial [Acinetobacter baumannii]